MERVGVDDDSKECVRQQASGEMMMGMEEMLNMVSQYVTVLMDSKMITNMSMVWQ